MNSANERKRTNVFERHVTVWVALRPLPAKMLKSIEALVGCAAGAVLVEETRAMAKAAGLMAIQLTPKAGYPGSHLHAQRYG